MEPTINNSPNTKDQVLTVRAVPPSVTNIRHFYDMENLEITCRDEYETASSYYLQIKSHLKLADEERQKITSPLNAALRNTNDLFKRISDPLNKIKDKLHLKMSTFADAERKKLEDAERERREAEKKKFEEQAREAKKEAIELGSETALETSNRFAKRASEVDTNNIEVSQTVRLGSQGTLSERRVWTWEVEDLSLVPRAYLVVDEKALNQIAKNQDKESTKVPGIRFFQKTTFAALTK